MLGRPLGLIQTLTLVVATKTQTMYWQALRLPLGWLARPTTPHDWTVPTWDQTLAEHLEWSYDQGTTEDMASKTLAAVRWALPNLPRPRSRSFPSAIASAQGTGAAGGSLACGTQPKTTVSPLLPPLRDVHAAVGRTGAAKCPAPSVDQRNLWASGHCSSEPASCLARQSSTTPACR